MELVVVLKLKHYFSKGARFEYGYRHTRQLNLKVNWQIGKRNAIFL